MSITSVIKGMFSSGVKDVIGALGGAIDKNVTSDEERLKLKNNLAEIENSANIKMEELSIGLEKEYTKRHAFDMQSDDKLSKKVRPMTLIYLVIVETILALTDGNIQFDTVLVANGIETIKPYTFIIKSSHIELFQILLVSVFGFYFGGRTIEKTMKIWKGR